MNVLICIPCLMTGGTEIQTLSLVKVLVYAGHRVTTVCYFEYTIQMKRLYKEAGCNVVCLSEESIRPNGLSSTIRLLYKGLKRLLSTQKFDIAHVQYMAPGAIPIILLKILGIKKIIATAHTMADIYPSLRLIHFLQRYVLTAFICITRKAEESFFGSSQLYSSDVQLKHKGNHFTIYNNLPDYIHIREQAKELQAVTTIGVVSRLEIIKGMDLVIPAFITIHQKLPHIKLLIVGDGSLRKDMEKQVQENDIASFVTFAGKQSQEQLQRWYDRIDVLLIPSRSEGFGLTAIEGMARGCVVIAANVGGIAEVVINNESGLLHHQGDKTDIIKQFLRLSSNPSMLVALSHGAIKRAKDFSTDNYTQQINDLYRAITTLS